MDKQLIEYLSQFVNDDRLQLFYNNLENRTRYLTIVLEDIFQPQNASAVLRSADCFGIQDIHIIENRNNFTVDREVAMGASKWLNLKRYCDDSENCRNAIRSLKSEGYRIIVTSPHRSDVNLEKFDLHKGKAALVFGTELTGVSDTIKKEADEFLKIPMYGFTESLNISVSAAIIMHHLTLRMKTESGINWKLNAAERDQALLHWLRKTIRQSDLLEKKFYEIHAK
ncbi:MAG: RNA methyltransferase [Bacteroidetes bacterium GWF2_42_66]|nr:MAG: RNA methyltransferase [Bacteroidetes bacterium GWA2_42_15]OFY00740.1 MAG: RNA methyltransferase [Bacteroidetes bacterium GWE2_42_39]OFY40765.1 MAG: RNA methyltransferase [Bacteroidetes bacterium GWF2_42_66]HBL75777.1 TrmH family RNA methyltransferase [Prolixibacteraceae bacterium]HCR89583.1 TrmH family RNA methyltransferase [Prolixibacteraceae bacterium]